MTSDDLYAAVEVVLAESNFNDFDFTTAFRTWENQKGYPLVHVTADDSSRSFRVTQKVCNETLFLVYYLSMVGCVCILALLGSN